MQDSIKDKKMAMVRKAKKTMKKRKKVIITNNVEFKKIAKTISSYPTSLNIELINTSVLQYLVDTEEKLDFVWLDYCGSFGHYIKDLDVLFAKKIDNIRLVLTYNLFDPLKTDDSYYFTRVIDYVLDKVSGKNKVRLMKDVSYRYKKTMYNLGFDIKPVTK